MKLTIQDGRDSFYTFDSNRILLLTATDEEQIKQVEFSTEEAGGTETWTKDVLEQEDGVKFVQVPNEFLNGDYTRLVCYAVALDSKGEFTRQKEVFRIKYRPQPEDWFLTYSERMTFASIKALTEQYKSNASDSAELASKYAENNEDVAVEPGKYSAKHWSIKSNKKYEEIRSYVGSASDPESALGSIESARANAVSDVEKQETDSIEAVGTYTSNTAIPSVSQYVEGTAKPALKTYGEQQVDSYVNGTSKPELDRYVNNEKKQVLDEYTAEKKTELDIYTSVDKKQVLDSYTENEKKTELDSHTVGLKEQLDAHTVAKAGDLNEYTTSLKGTLDGYTTAKEQDISEFTEQKKSEVQGVYQSDLNELKGDLDEFSNCIVNAKNVSVKILGSFGSGGLTNNIFNPNQKYRCSSTDIVYSKFPIKCHVANGFRFGWVITNEDGTSFDGWKGWYTSDAVIPQGIYFKFQIARVTEDTTEISNVSEFTSAITISTQFERLNDVISDVEELKLYSDVLIEQGALYNGLESPSDKFVRTAKIIKGKKILINNTTNFAMSIVAYYYNDNGVFVDGSPAILVNVGGSTVFSPTLTKNYRLRIGKGGETVITSSDVSGAFKSITQVTYSLYERERSRQLSLQYKDIMIGFAHRGASNLAPENTASAFKLASKLGYIAVETDFRFTSDGVPVIIHDATVDRTSNLSGDVGSMTLEQLKNGDFGSWFSSDFSGEKILTFDECIKLCKQLGLIVVMEQKQWLESDRIKQVCDIVKKYDMCESVWWVGDTVSIIVQFARNIPNATIGYVVDNIPPEYEAKLDALKSASDRVYISMRNTKITDEKANTLMNKGIKLYAWTIDSDTEIMNLHPYVSGVFSNNLNAAVVLNDNI